MAEPATTIINRCGGVSVVAEWLKLNPTSVQRWTYPKERGGTGGLVPSKRQEALMRAAREHGKVLRPEDFFRLDGHGKAA